MPEEFCHTFAPASPRPEGGPHRIVIVGGGAGGLELAVRLGDGLGRWREAEVVLVDPLLTHLWKPLLHEVAAGTLAAEDSGLDFLQQARRHHFRFHLGAMDSLDRQEREIGLSPLLAEDGQEIAPRRRLWYDTLVLSVGSQGNDFGVPGVREHAFPLNGADDARHFHRRLLAMVARVEMSERGPVQVVIVGGGATGVELAAELAEATREMASYGLRLRQFPRAVNLCLVDTGPRLLAAMPEYVARKAEADLLARGVDIRLRQRVTGVRAGSVILSDELGSREIPADLTVWAAGIQGPEFLAGLDGLESNRLRQLVVRPTLQTTRDDRIFAFGDCASLEVGGEAPVPPKAQAAHQEARFLARALGLRLKGRPLPDFRFHDRGSLVSLGRREAVGSLADELRGRSLVVEGWLARFSYWLLYRRHLVALVGVGRTFLATLGHWLAGRTQPRVKLH